MNVNSYVVHGPTGVVVVDGQLCRDDGEQVRRAVADTGLPLTGVLLTHGHPDHYAAVGTFAPPDVPVVATRGVDAVIRRDDAEKDAVVGPMMGDQWPSHRPFPTRVVDSGETVELAGLTLTVTEVGPAESHCDSYWQLDDRTLFVGDLCYAAQHAYLADGHARRWLEVLTALEGRWPHDAVLHPGHGPVGGTELLARQAAYVEAFLRAVERHAGDDADERERAVLAAVGEHVQDDSLLFLTRLSIPPAVAATTAP